MPDKRGRKPRSAKTQLTPPTIAVNFDDETPKFCLAHLQRGFDVNSLDPKGKAFFAETLQDRSKMTWSEIKMSDKHGAGTELIPRRDIRGPIPEGFQSEDRFMMLRYRGKLPMGGVRINDVLHILWIEPKFGDLYDHGS